MAPTHEYAGKIWGIRDGGRYSGHALHSKLPATRAILFVHGFGGGALRTWGRLKQYAMTSEELAATDCFFFGYPSVRHQIAVVVEKLNDFVDSIAAPYTARSGASYERLVLVGHSLGGVVVRSLVHVRLDHDNPLDHVDRLVRDADVRLFASAHGGALPSGVLGVAMAARGLSEFANIVRGGSPTMRQLERGSGFLSDLERDTIAMDSPSSAATTVWARNDRVVEQKVWRPKDPRIRSIADESHRSICKPGSKTSLPMLVVGASSNDHVLDAIERSR